MSVMDGDIPNLFKQKLEENASQKQKTFLWDSVVFSIAFYIFWLSVSSFIVELFNSTENSVACLTPLKNRDQNTYVNSYCHKQLPDAGYFPLILVLQATFLVAPHYFWKAAFSAEIETFFSHAARVDILREVNTGKYPHKNYRIVNYLQREFDNNHLILISYGLKLFIQLLLVVGMFITNGNILAKDITFECKNITIECKDISFECNDDSQTFSQVTCAYPKMPFINFLLVFDYILLAAATFMLLIGFYWLLFWNHSTEDHKKIVKFCYDSCIDAQYYYKPPKRCKRCPRGLLQMRNDFSFLISSLHSGLKRVFRTIQIEDAISQNSSKDLQKLVPGN